MIKRFLIFKAMVLVCLMTMLGRHSSANETNNLPAVFNASIGGFFGISYSLKLTNDTVFYSARKAGKVVDSAKIIPSAAQWEEFHDALDRLKVWQWRTNYINHKVFDGTQWSLEIKCAGHSLKTSGSNDFPKSEGRPNGMPEYTDEFRKYLRAIEILLGEKKFE